GRTREQAGSVANGRAPIRYQLSALIAIKSRACLLTSAAEIRSLCNDSIRSLHRVRYPLPHLAKTPRLELSLRSLNIVGHHTGQYDTPDQRRSHHHTYSFFSPGRILHPPCTPLSHQSLTSMARSLPCSNLLRGLGK